MTQRSFPCVVIALIFRVEKPEDPPALHRSSVHCAPGMNWDDWDELFAEHLTPACLAESGRLQNTGPRVKARLGKWALLLLLLLLLI